MVENDLSTVAVVGLGKIGLPLAVQYALHGKRVIGCDINPQVVATINAGQSHVQEEAELAIELPGLVYEGRLSATRDTTEAIRQATVVVVIVPVMIDEEQEVNFQAIDAATEAIGAGLQPGTLVIYETTLPVGTTSQRFAHILERLSGLKAGRDFSLAYSPERVSSGHIFRDLRTYPKVIGGIDEKSTTMALQFYQAVLNAPTIKMASTDEAEFVKLIETTYRDVNIALANEFARYADLYGLDVTSAIGAANTQPYSHIHTPGVGVGGHCIPVYPYFLLSGLKEKQIEVQSTQPALLSLPRKARQINDAMAVYAVERLQSAAGSLARQAVLILGIAYRGNVREVAFTSAKLLQKALFDCGAEVYIDEPLFSTDEIRSLGYTPLTADKKDQIRAIILQADHQEYQHFDFSQFSHCQVVLDGRRVLKRDPIEALGIRYITIGDGEQTKTQNGRNKEHTSTAHLLERGQQ